VLLVLWLHLCCFLLQTGLPSPEPGPTAAPPLLRCQGLLLLLLLLLLLSDSPCACAAASLILLHTV
jgi:hypothetical protein